MDVVVKVVSMRVVGSRMGRCSEGAWETERVVAVHNGL